MHVNFIEYYHPEKARARTPTHGLPLFIWKTGRQQKQLPLSVSCQLMEKDYGTMKNREGDPVE